MKFKVTFVALTILVFCTNRSTQPSQGLRVKRKKCTKTKLVPFSFISLEQARTEYYRTIGREVPPNGLKSPHLPPKGPKSLHLFPKGPKSGVICGTRATDDVVAATWQSLKVKAIIHGNNAPEKWWPWQVFIIGHLACGGALISDRWVLTAAHCLGNITYLGLGRTNLSRRTEYIQERTALTEIRHERFNLSPIQNDIGLVKLNKPVEFTDYVRPACLPRSGASFENVKDCFISGWGRTQPVFGSNPSVLQMLKTRVMNQSECLFRHLFAFQSISNGHMCLELNGTSPGEGTCKGDSGGPLSCKVNGKYYVAGIASFGQKECKKTFPDVFMSVSFYENWIQSKMAFNR